MDRIRKALQADLFACRVFLPKPAQKELLPLVAALIMAVMTSTPPVTADKGADDEE